MARSLRPITSLLLGVLFLLAGSGLQFVLLPLRGSAEGFGDVAIGLIGSAYYVGFVSGCLFSPYVILRAGHIRAFAAMVAVAAAVALAHALAPAPVPWILLRMITGFCLAGFYLVVESWLNDHASNENRGLVMSAYVVVNLVALAVGQMLVTLHPIHEAASFMIAAILSSLAIVPVALTRAQPAPITIVSFRPAQLYRAAPVALIASLMVGIANGAFWSLGPVSVAGSGLPVHQVAWFMTLAVLGGALAQWPIGRLSDRFDRRLVLLALLIGALLTGVALWFTAASGALLLAFGVLFGALALPGYSLAAAHGYDKTPRGDVVATAATILLANGAGSVIGPLLASPLMSWHGPRVLFLFTAAAQTLLAAYVLYRTRVQASLTPPEKTEFDIATTSPIGTVVTAEAPSLNDPSVAVPKAYHPHTAESGEPAPMRADAEE
jgi:MFS family permease